MAAALFAQRGPRHEEKPGRLSPAQCVWSAATCHLTISAPIGTICSGSSLLFTAPLYLVTQNVIRSARLSTEPSPRRLFGFIASLSAFPSCSKSYSVHINRAVNERMMIASFSEQRVNLMISLFAYRQLYKCVSGSHCCQSPFFWKFWPCLKSPSNNICKNRKSISCPSLRGDSSCEGKKTAGMLSRLLKALQAFLG